MPMKPMPDQRESIRKKKHLVIQDEGQVAVEHLTDRDMEGGILHINSAPRH